TTFCSGGTVTLTSSSAAGNLWSNGATTPSITVSTPGNYAVTVTDANGCSAASASTTVAVNVPPAPPVINASGPATFCSGGSVTLTSSSATGNVWSTGETTQSITVSASGNYSVAVTNGNGCSATSAATTVTVNPNPATPTISAGGPLAFCAGGSVTLTSSSATGNVWSTGETTQSIAVSASGNYSVTVTNGNGCSATSAGTTVTVNPNPATPTISAGGPLAFCPGGSVTLTSSSATGNVWSTGATTQSITVNASGTYTVTVTNGNGCSATSAGTTVTVNPNPSTPTISAGGTTTFCAGGSVTLTSSSATGNVWSTGETTQSITVSASGNYSVTVTNGNGCSATSASTTVTVNPTPATPVISASGPTTFCPGGNITLTSNSAAGNLWSNGATTPSITVGTSGNYSVTVTDGNGCSAISGATSILVQDAVAPQITCPNTVTVNANATCTATAVALGSPVVSDNCSVLSVLNNAPATFPLGSRNVIWTVSDPTGNTNTCTQTVLVVDNTLPNITCPMEIGVNAAPGTCQALVTYAQPSFNDNCPGITLSQVSGLPSGSTFPVGSTVNVFRVTSPNGQTRDCSFAVTVFDSEGPSISPIADIVVSSGANACGANVSWPAPSVSENCVGCPSASTPSGFTPIGTYQGRRYFRRTTSEPWAVANERAKSVHGHLAIVRDAATNNWLRNAMTAAGVTGGFWIGLTDAGSTDTYRWTNSTPVVFTNWPSDGSEPNNNGGQEYYVEVEADGDWNDEKRIVSSPYAIELEADCNVAVQVAGPANGSWFPVGNTPVSYRAVDAAGNETIRTFTVTVLPNNTAPTITANGPLTFCAGDSVILISSSSTNNSWSTGATSDRITVKTTGTYSVTVDNGPGCSSTSDPVVVNVHPDPSIPTIMPSGPSTFCPGGSVTLTSSAAASYLWSNGATTQATTVNTTDSYTVSTTDSNGCSATSAPVQVTTQDLTPPTINCPSNISVTADPGYCGKEVMFSASATDDCTPTPTITYSTLPGSEFTIGAPTTVIASASDGVNPPSTCTFMVTVNAPLVDFEYPVTTICQNAAPVAPSFISHPGGTFSDANQAGTIDANGLFDPSSANVGPHTLGYVFNTGAGCVHHDWFLINVVAAPVINTGNYPPLCINDPALALNATPAGGSWAGPGIVGNTFDPLVAGIGTHVVTYTSNSGSCTASESTTITVLSTPSTPLITASGPTTFCAGDSVVLSSSAATSYLWSSGATTQNITVSATGNYNVAIGNGSGCSSISANTSVTVNPLPTPVVTADGPTTFCTGGSVNLVSSSSSGNVWTTGATTPSITVMTSGSYAVAVTDINGCSAMSSAVPVQVDTPPQPVIAPIPVLCSSGGPIELVGTPSTGTWSGPGVIGASFNPGSAGPGNHTITYTVGQPGCINTATINIQVDEQFIAPPFSYPGSPFCTSGSVVPPPVFAVTPNAGGSFTNTGLSAFDSATGQFNAGGTSPGTYAVTYTSATNGVCPSLSIITMVQVNTSVSAGNDATIELCGTASPVPLFGSLPGANTGGTWISPLGVVHSGVYDPVVDGSGIYRYTVTGPVGCGSDTAVVEVSETPEPNGGTLVGDADHCGTSNTGTLLLSGHTGNLQWQKRINGGPWTDFANATNSYTYSNLPVGMYDYRVVLDAPGCPQAMSNSVTVRVSRPPNAGTANPIFICQGTSFTLDVLVTSEDVNGIWTDVNGAVVSGTVAPIATTAYTYTVPTNGSCASDARTVQVTVIQPPNAGSNGSISVCSTDPALNLFDALNGTPSTGGTWTGPSPITGGFYDAMSMVPGTYTYTVNGQIPCPSVQSAVIVSEVTATSNTTSISACDTYTWSVNGATYTQSGTYTDVDDCHTETLVLTIVSSTNNTTTVSACDTYTWNISGLTYTESGTYTSVSGCGTQTLVLTITPSTTNTTTISACDTYTWSVNGAIYTQSGTYTDVDDCHTETLVLTITPSTNNTTTISACDTYTWSVNSVTYTQSGTYVHSVGCANDTLNLSIVPTPTAAFDLGAGTFCTNEQAVLPEVSTPGGLFSSSEGSAVDPMSGAIDPASSVPGSYTITYTIDGQCPSSATVNVTIVAAPNAEWNSPVSICDNSGSLQLAELAENAGGVWSGSGVTGTTLDPGGMVGPVTITYTVENSGCTASVSNEIIVIGAPLSVAGPDTTICGYELLLTGAASSGTGIWSGPVEVLFMDPNAPNTNVIATGAGSYTLVWTVSENGCSSSDTTIVTMRPPADQLNVFAGEDQILEVETTTTLEAITDAGAQVEWTLVGGSAQFDAPNSAATIVSGLSLGTNTVMVTVSLGSCTGTSDTLTITVEDLFIPQGFSPNGDGDNDRFEVTGMMAYPNSSFTVFNRWGQKVYENSAYSNEWDGRSAAGTELPDDTYFYVLNLEGDRTYNGFVVIKR
ncbi:MAG: HYR domain-containing protein, partial [Flavobacteriales bacterium]|nr:HYR domain-containing protein [Flavobacteriales bacterium]